jgi:aminoglycoside phosphotransferase (APT) family kinase protein
MPTMSRASIVHNDLKLDNCQFDPANPDRVASIFDWDMATLGDPLIDLGTLLNYWPDPDDPPEAQRFNNPGLPQMGLPTRAELTARYAARTGVEVAAVRWWEAFALWKTVVVVQQLHRRWVRGESTDPRMAQIADRIPCLISAAEAALDHLGPSRN